MRLPLQRPASTLQAWRQAGSCPAGVARSLQAAATRHSKATSTHESGLQGSAHPRTEGQAGTKAAPQTCGRSPRCPAPPQSPPRRRLAAAERREREGSNVGTRTDGTGWRIVPAACCPNRRDPTLRLLTSGSTAFSFCASSVLLRSAKCVRNTTTHRRPGSARHRLGSSTAAPLEAE